MIPQSQPATYERDIIAWAQEQARLLRTGQFDKLDIEHIADEVEDVGRSEQRELASRVTVLLAHLLKWQFQPVRRGASWSRTIKAQRLDVAYLLAEAPSLKPRLSDQVWMNVVWAKAVAQAVEETSLDVFPDACPWSVDQIMSPSFFPEG